MGLDALFENNRNWSNEMRRRDPEFFRRLADQQSPEYLWIGCSDSRVPANEIVGLAPGELFVHRNVANIVVHSDLNCLSVMQFAVQLLGVKHIIVCGHYGCSGVRTALHGNRVGIADNWLRHVQDVRDKHDAELRQVESDPARADRLCELNVIEQVLNVCNTSVILDAWQRGQQLSVHGWAYGLQDGLLHDLATTINGEADAAAIYAAAISRR